MSFLYCVIQNATNLYFNLDIQIKIYNSIFKYHDICFWFNFDWFNFDGFNFILMDLILICLIGFLILTDLILTDFILIDLILINPLIILLYEIWENCY